jgi:hypothetical protein
MFLALVVSCASGYDSWTCRPPQHNTQFAGLRMLNSLKDTHQTTHIYSAVSKAIISGETSGQISSKFLWKASDSGIVSVWATSESEHA